jgi:hypothetical protein
MFNGSFLKAGINLKSEFVHSDLIICKQNKKISAAAQFSASSSRIDPMYEHINKFLVN